MLRNTEQVTVMLCNTCSWSQCPACRVKWSCRPSDCQPLTRAGLNLENKPYRRIGWKGLQKQLPPQKLRHFWGFAQTDIISCHPCHHSRVRISRVESIHNTRVSESEDVTEPRKSRNIGVRTKHRKHNGYAEAGSVGNVTTRPSSSIPG